MSNGMNRVTLLGNLGSDPELRAAGAGAVLKMRLATNEAWLGKDGTLTNHTEWHDVALFGKRAEALSRLLVKGDRVVVEGALRTSSYEGKEGGTRYRTEVLARDVILAGGRRRTGTDVAGDPFAGIDDVPTDQLPPPSAGGRRGTIVADVTAG